MNFAHRSLRDTAERNKYQRWQSLGNSGKQKIVPLHLVVDPRRYGPCAIGRSKIKRSDLARDAGIAEQCAVAREQLTVARPDCSFYPVPSIHSFAPNGHSYRTMAFISHIRSSWTDIDCKLVGIRTREARTHGYSTWIFPSCSAA